LASLRLRKAVLERDGFSVFTASTPARALQMLREAPICLTISDHMLSDATGVELARQMKNIKPDVPIVLHSGGGPSALENIDCFIHKGEPTATFLSLIHELVRRFYA
jgi:DNA-binding NtrC family response regulator